MRPRVGVRRKGTRTFREVGDFELTANLTIRSAIAKLAIGIAFSSILNKHNSMCSPQSWGARGAKSSTHILKILESKIHFKNVI